MIYQLSRDNFHLSRDVLILLHNEKKCGMSSMSHRTNKISNRVLKTALDKKTCCLPWVYILLHFSRVEIAERWIDDDTLSKISAEWINLHTFYWLS